MLRNRLENRESGLLFYGLTPPKETTDNEKIKLIADRQIGRLKDIEIDGLILYDIQDESSRTNAPRPFPFMPTLAPDYYSNNFLRGLKIPKIIYKSVGKYSETEFSNWLEDAADNVDCAVFVGSPSKNQASNLLLEEAYRIKQKSNTSFPVGGIAIPERHFKKGDEHLRLMRKINNGCSFFISQCVYSINNTKDFLSDYYYHSIEQNVEMAPIIFTLTPCGSLKTLQFMKWLGIDIPKWLNNDLKRAKNILSDSIDICNSIATEILDYSVAKNIPVGFNIESVAVRKEEIEASIELLKNIRKLTTI